LVFMSYFFLLVRDYAGIKRRPSHFGLNSTDQGPATIAGRLRTQEFQVRQVGVPRDRQVLTRKPLQHAF